MATVIQMSTSVDTDELKARIAVLDAALNKTARKRLAASPSRKTRVWAALLDGLVHIKEVEPDADAPRS